MNGQPDTIFRDRDGKVLLAPWVSVASTAWAALSEVAGRPPRRTVGRAARAARPHLSEYGTEKIVRDLRVHQSLEGTNEIMRVIAARGLTEAFG